jgi:hypothetical protein
MRIALVALALCGCGVLRSPNGPESSAPVLVALHRAACLGPCPDYEVIVYEDGVVEYHGHSNTRVIGRRTSRLDGAAVARLVRSFERAHFLSLDDYAESDCTDMIYAELTYRGKTVHYDMGNKRAPRTKLNLLEAEVDDVTDSIRWVGEAERDRAPLVSSCD